MSRLSEAELESYDLEVLHNIAKEAGMNSNMINTMNKDFLIKIILFKDKQTEKWAVGEYHKYKEEQINEFNKYTKNPEKEKSTSALILNEVEKYIPPHKREAEQCLFNTDSDSDSDWDTSKWYMPGDEMKTFNIY